MNFVKGELVCCGSIFMVGKGKGGGEITGYGCGGDCADVGVSLRVRFGRGFDFVCWGFQGGGEM